MKIHFQPHQWVFKVLFISQWCLKFSWKPRGLDMTTVMRLSLLDEREKSDVLLKKFFFCVLAKTPQVSLWIFISALTCRHLTYLPCYYITIYSNVFPYDKYEQQEMQKSLHVSFPGPSVGVIHEVQSRLAPLCGSCPGWRGPTDGYVINSTWVIFPLHHTETPPAPGWWITS